MNWPLIFIIAALVLGIIGGLVMWARFGAGSSDDGGL